MCNARELIGKLERVKEAAENFSEFLRTANGTIQHRGHATFNRLSYEMAVSLRNSE